MRESSLQALLWLHSLNIWCSTIPHNVHAFGFLTGTSSLTVLACTSTSLNACLGSKNLLSILSGATKPGEEKKTTKLGSDVCKVFLLITDRHLQLPLTLTDDEDLGGLVPRRLRLGGLHLLEELLEDPEQRLVVFGAEDLGDESATFGQELAGQLQGHEGQMSWRRSGGDKVRFWDIRFKWRQVAVPLINYKHTRGDRGKNVFLSNYMQMLYQDVILSIYLHSHFWTHGTY